MLIHRIIFLLLSWSYVRAIEDEKPPPTDIFDQVATASENLRIRYPTASKSTPKPITASTIKATAIHYENSNGFIPMTSMEGSLIAASQNLELNATSSDNDPSWIDLTTQKVSELFEDDPAYSTEARMFLNLPGPGANRRSFDAQDGQNEFEILKVTNETPAIANYHDFYENMQSNLNRKPGGTQGRYIGNEEPENGRTVAQNQRTKQRIKKIEKYLTNFHGDQERDVSNSYKQYYSHGNENNKPVNTQNKAIFEPEKVQPNFNQHTGSSIYNNYDERLASHQRTSTLRSNYDDSATNSRHSQKSYGYSGPINRHVKSKPVVVVEPGDYKLDLKYGPQEVVAKVSNMDNYRIQKSRNEPTKLQAGNRYDKESRVNSEDRYGHSYERLEDTGDYSDDGNDYLEVTEKPRRIHKNRRRPYGSENSKRLPKEHRGHQTDDLDLDDSRKHNSATRSKPQRPKAKPSYWIDDDRSPISEESSEDQSNNDRSRSTPKPEVKNSKPQHFREKNVNQWSQVAPNIEISHSNGYQVNQIDKPKLLVPVNLNLVPLTNFDHSTALGNSQGFDFTNIPNFITASPMMSTAAPLLSTSQSSISSNIANLATGKNLPTSINNNYGIPTSVSDVIVGQNTYQNPVQAVLLPHMNVHTKFTPNLRTQYLPSTVAPMFTVTQTMNPNVQNINPTMQSIPIQNFHSTVSPRPASSINQNLHHLTMNPVSPAASQQPQLLVSQPTLQSFPLLQTPYHGNSNYNILVNPNGLHGQNMVQQGNLNIQGSTTPSPQSSSTTPQMNSIPNDNLHTSESQMRKNNAPNANGQFLATASFAVGNGEQYQQSNAIANNNKYFLPANNDNGINNNNNNYYNGNQNNQQTMRPQQNENFYQLYRDDQNNNQKIKTYIQTPQVLPGIIHPAQNIPVNYNNQNYANMGGQLQEQQSMLSPNIVAQRPRDQNQQILKAANDIFENTWKQLQQLQTNDGATKNNPYQNIYRVNDNLGSTSNSNANTVNSLQNVNSVKAHLPVLGTQNVEILNPNIRPSPVDLTFMNPYQTLHHYPAAVLTTPIPIFSTTASFLTPRPPVSSTTAQSINLQNYVDSLTQMGAHSNQVNKLESAHGPRNQEYQRPIFNPINFVPNLDLMKSQSMLNGKLGEPLPHQLNLVPLIPGGNFFKNTFGAQSELVHKPRLSSDLEKYAEEMFKESMKTIYSTHKWNNDRRARGNYSAADLNDLAKLKSELQRFKASLSDSKQTGKDILEAHHSETKLRTAEPVRTTKKPELSIAAIEQLFKSDFKHKSPSSSDSSQNSHHKNRPNSSLGSSRPSSDSFNDFRNLMQLNDYLTPPKPNSFISKSPFIDSSNSVKKRPGSSSSRYNSNNKNARPLPRPSSLVSRPASGPEASASNHLESGIRSDGSRYEKYQHRPTKYSHENDHYFSEYRRDPSFDSYPTFTTTSSPDNDSFKSSSSEQSTKTDYYDINHPRMHNLLGLLMKNKQLPTGSSQSFFRNDDELEQYFEDEKRRLQLQFYDETMKNFEKKADAPPINMGPPARPKIAQIRYYPGRGTA